MDVAGLKLDISFPGRAGELQGAGATAALVRELGDNYETYHRFLVEEGKSIGSRPDPKDFLDDYDGYTKLCDRILDLLAAESILRRCRGQRKLGRELNVRYDDEPPLVDERHRLINVANPAATKQDNPDGDKRLADAKPPPPPRPGVPG